jgi:hypothetical protein
MLSTLLAVCMVAKRMMLLPTAMFCTGSSSNVMYTLCVRVCVCVWVVVALECVCATNTRGSRCCSSCARLLASARGRGCGRARATPPKLTGPCRPGVMQSAHTYTRPPTQAGATRLSLLRQGMCAHSAVENAVTSASRASLLMLLSAALTCTWRGPRASERARSVTHRRGVSARVPACVGTPMQSARAVHACRACLSAAQARVLHARTRARTHARTHTHTHTHTHARTHARTHAHTHARTHARTRTHAHTQPVVRARPSP